MCKNRVARKGKTPQSPSTGPGRHWGLTSGSATACYSAQRFLPAWLQLSPINSRLQHYCTGHRVTISEIIIPVHIAYKTLLIRNRAPGSRSFSAAPGICSQQCSLSDIASSPVITRPPVSWQIATGFVSPFQVIGLHIRSDFQSLFYCCRQHILERPWCEQQWEQIQIIQSKSRISEHGLFRLLYSCFYFNWLFPCTLTS